jgi:hypothetical protein
MRGVFVSWAGGLALTPALAYQPGLSLGMGFVLAQNRIRFKEPDAVLNLIAAFDHLPARARPTIECAQGAGYWH